MVMPPPNPQDSPQPTSDLSRPRLLPWSPIMPYGPTTYTTPFLFALPLCCPLAALSCDARVVHQHVQFGEIRLHARRDSLLDPLQSDRAWAEPAPTRFGPSEAGVCPRTH